MKNISAIFLASSILLSYTNVSASVIDSSFGGDGGIGTETYGGVFDNYIANEYGYFEAELPFSVNYAGNSYQNSFVNQDGGLVFTQESSLEQYFYSDTSDPRITALHSMSDRFNESNSTVFVGQTEDKFSVTWVDLKASENAEQITFGPHVSSPESASNTFQMVLIDRSDTGEGNFDVEFRYENVDWWSYSYTDGDGFRGFDGGDGTEAIDINRYEPRPYTYTYPGEVSYSDGNVSTEDGITKYTVREGIAYQGADALFKFSEPEPPESTGDMAFFEWCTDYYNSNEGSSEPSEGGMPILPEGQTAREACAEWAGVDLSDEVLVSTGSGSAEDPFMPISGEEVEGWNFAFEVVAGQLQAIDPNVAVGYEYVVNSGPNVQSVVLPSGFDDNLFDIFTKDNGNWQLAADDWLAGDEFIFSQAVTEFKVEGIDITNAIDPLDPQAFITQISFDDSGFVDMTQTPITQYVTDVPEPQTLFIFAGALSTLALMRRRKLIVK